MICKDSANPTTSSKILRANVKKNEQSQMRLFLGGFVKLISILLSAVNFMLHILACFTFYVHINWTFSCNFLMDTLRTFNRCSDGSKILKWGPNEPPTFKTGGGGLKQSRGHHI